MRCLSAFLAILIISSLLAGAQEKKKDEQRPTLGPPPAASTGEAGPTSAITVDPGRLTNVRKIFIEPMDNRLSDKLLDGLGKSGRFRIVAERNQADAVLRGTCFDSRRLRTLHSEVFLNDRVTGKSIWQDSIHVPYNPPSLAKAVGETSDAILKHLARSVMQVHP